MVTSANSSVEFLNSAQSGDSVFLVKFNKLRDTDVHVLRLDPVSNQIELIKTNPYVTNAGMENRYCPGIISVPKMFFPNC